MGEIIVLQPGDLDFNGRFIELKQAFVLVTKYPGLRKAIPP
jgi:hypothetical protein